MEFIKKLKGFEDFVSAKGASNESIKQAEETLGLTFAKEYKNYLRECGIATADGHEFTGITTSDRLSVISTTQSARDKMDNAPEGLYVVERAQIDGILVWQSQDGTVYKTVKGNVPEKIAKSLAEYL